MGLTTLPPLEPSMSLWFNAFVLNIVGNLPRVAQSTSSEPEPINPSPAPPESLFEDADLVWARAHPLPAFMDAGSNYFVLPPSHHGHSSMMFVPLSDPPAPRSWYYKVLLTVEGVTNPIYLTFSEKMYDTPPNILITRPPLSANSTPATAWMANSASTLQLPAGAVWSTEPFP